MNYPVKLQTFEGPLDLLLHLIDQAEVDIYDIPIAEITDQYLNYLYNMQEFKIDIASEFLVMAATLLAIKSKMLLPKHEELANELFGEWEEEVDPREELVQRLIEYKRYKTVSEILQDLEFQRNQVYTRPPEDITRLYSQDHEQTPNYNISILQLFVSFQSILKKHKEENKVTTISKEEISVNDKINEIQMLLHDRNEKVYFSQFFKSVWSRTELVVTFLAILELIKLQKIKINQSVNFDDIEIYLV